MNAPAYCFQKVARMQNGEEISVNTDGFLELGERAKSPEKQRQTEYMGQEQETQGEKPIDFRGFVTSIQQNYKCHFGETLLKKLRIVVHDT